MTVTGTTRSVPVTAAAVPAVLISSTVMVIAVLYSPWGSVLLLDDAFSLGAVVAPLLAGAFVGTLQSTAFGRRLVLVTVGMAALATVPTIIYLYPAVAHFVGVSVGTFLGPRLRPVGRPRVAMVALAVTTLLAGSFAITRITAPEPPLLVLDVAPGRPAVLLDPQRRAPEILRPVEGVLVDAGGCLGLRPEGAAPDAEPYVVFLPDDTEVQDAPFGVVLDGTSRGLGDRVALRGAVLERRLGPLDYADELPDRCEPFDVLMT